MRLPSLTVIVVSLAIIWSVAGTSIHGPLILLYPAVWLVVGIGFFIHSKMYPLQVNAGANLDPGLQQKEVASQRAASETPEPAKLAATD